MIDGAHGKVSYIPGEAVRLNLGVGFESRTTENLEDFKFLYGELEDGSKATLVDPFKVGHKMNFSSAGRYRSFKYIFNLMFVGDVFIEKDTHFHSAVCQFSQLSNWINRNPFSIKKNIKKKITISRSP